MEPRNEIEELRQELATTRQDLSTTRQDVCALTRWIMRREGQKAGLVQILERHEAVDAGPETRDQLDKTEVIA